MTVTTSSRHLTASMVVIDPTARTVLLVWHKATGKLMFPGGHVDPDETPFDAATREVFEETALTHLTAHRTEPLTQLPGMRQEPNPWVTYEIPAPAKPDRPGKPAEPAHSHIDMLFIATANSEMPLEPALGEVLTAGWYPVAELGDRDVRAEVPHLAAAAMRLFAGTPADVIAGVR
jgi:8-oxo-dGTP pyrophosphatase MutT (NUDIX family)